MIFDNVHLLHHINLSPKIYLNSFNLTFSDKTKSMGSYEGLKKPKYR